MKVRVFVVIVRTTDRSLALFRVRGSCTFVIRTMHSRVGRLGLLENLVSGCRTVTLAVCGFFNIVFYFRLEDLSIKKKKNS